MFSSKIFCVSEKELRIEKKLVYMFDVGRFWGGSTYFLLGNIKY